MRKYLSSLDVHEMKTAAVLLLLGALVTPSFAVGCYICNNQPGFHSAGGKCDTQIALSATTEYAATETRACPDAVTMCQTTVVRVTTVIMNNNQTRTSTIVQYNRDCADASGCRAFRANCTTIQETMTTQCTDSYCCSSDQCNGNIGGSGSGSSTATVSSIALLVAAFCATLIHF